MNTNVVVVSGNVYGEVRGYSDSRVYLMLTTNTTDIVLCVLLNPIVVLEQVPDAGAPEARATQLVAELHANVVEVVIPDTTPPRFEGIGADRCGLDFT